MRPAFCNWVHMHCLSYFWILNWGPLFKAWVLNFYCIFIWAHFCCAFILVFTLPSYYNQVWRFHPSARILQASHVKSSPSILNSFITSPQSFIITINLNTWCTQLIISWEAGIIIILNNCKCERVVGWGARLQHHLLATVWLSPPWLKVYSLWVEIDLEGARVLCQSVLAHAYVYHIIFNHTVSYTIIVYFMYVYVCAYNSLRNKLHAG